MKHSESWVWVENICFIGYLVRKSFELDGFCPYQNVLASEQVQVHQNVPKS